MASLVYTLNNAFRNYSKQLGKFGLSKHQDKYKLLILSYLFYLVYQTDYLFNLDTDTNSPTFGTFSLDQTKFNRVQKIFNTIMRCFPNNSCCVFKHNSCYFEQPVLPNVTFAQVSTVNSLGTMSSPASAFALINAPTPTLIVPF